MPLYVQENKLIIKVPGRVRATFPPTASSGPDFDFAQICSKNVTKQYRIQNVAVQTLAGTAGGVDAPGGGVYSDP